MLTGQYDEAAESFTRTLEINSANIEAWQEKGKALTILEKYASAVEAFDGYLSVKPDSPEILFRKGLALTELGKNEPALETFEMCIALGLDTAAIHAELAQCLVSPQPL